MISTCHLISSTDVGGAEMSLLRLVTALDRDRFKCAVVTMVEIGHVGTLIQERGVEVRSLNMRRGRFSPSRLIRLVSWLRADRPDILMTWLYHADLLGLLAGAAARVSHVVWNLRAADMDMGSYRPMSGLVRRLCARLSPLPRAIVANSIRSREYHAGIGYRAREWAVIRNGVDCRCFHPDALAREDVRRELGVPPETPLIGLVARYDPMKDHDNFVQAARLVALAEPSVHFALAGRGVDLDNRALTSAARNPPLAGRLHLLGERFDVPRLTAALDVACSASRSESFPNTVAEAMASGIVCVATDVGDSAEILGDAGFIVPPMDAPALADGLQCALAMRPEQRRALGLAARDRAVSTISLERCVANYETFFENIGSGRNNRDPQ